MNPLPFHLLKLVELHVLPVLVPGIAADEFAIGTLIDYCTLMQHDHPISLANGG